MGKKRLFGAREVNMGRQIEADIAKTICIVGMVFVHCFEMLNPAAEETTASFIMVTVLDVLFGAGTFMFCMGFGIAYSRGSTPDKLMKRGLHLLLLAYVLAFVRDLLPYGILTGFLRDAAYLKEGLFYFFCGDILQFAGLALFLFGFLRKLRLSAWGIGGIAVGMSVLGSFIRDFDLGNYIVDHFAGLFFGTVCAEYGEKFEACFPLFNWFIFVAAGYLFAVYLRRCTDKKRFYTIASGIGAAVLFIYMAVTIPRRLGMMGEDLDAFYHLTMPEALVCICAAVTVLGGYYALSHVLPQKVQDACGRVSRNINRIYCIHWIIIGFLSIPLELLDYPVFPDWVIFGIGILILAAALFLADLRGKREKAK